MKEGLNHENAKTIADSLIEADLRGVDSHGVVRAAIYLERVQKGMINPFNEVKIASDNGPTVLIDGKNNVGAVVGEKALKVALLKAKKFGIGAVGVKGSNHFGTGAYYVKKALKQNQILIVMSNASQTMPPTGGIRPFIGTNPLAVGIPAGKYQSFILDMATSVVARGKIIVAAQRGIEIPIGWAVDKNGEPTTNAEEGLEGSVLPIGGAKGYGLSMFIDIISGVLTGSGFGKYVNNMYENWDEAQNVGHFFITIDIGRYLPIEQFKERMDAYITEIKAEPRANGVEEIFIPGEIEHFKAEKKKKNGIELSQNVVEDLIAAGKKRGVTFPNTLKKKGE